MSSFDVRIFAIRRRPGRRVFEVRWRVAGCDKSRSFITRALADSYRRGAGPRGALGYAVGLGLLPPTRPTRGDSGARRHRRRRYQSIHRRQPGADPGDPGPGRLRPAGSGRVLRLPVLRRAAPRRKPWRCAAATLSSPAHGRGKMILSSACPAHRHRLASTGRPHETRGLKHRPNGTTRVVPIPARPGRHAPQPPPLVR